MGADSDNHILAAGVLAGVLIESGAAEKIAETIVEKLGEKKAILALAIATLVITAVGVFITVSVIIVAPIALSIAKKAKLTKPAILLAMIGGGKAGNIISPNPNTIAVAKGFDVDLVQVMIGGFIPAVVGVIVTYIVASFLNKKGSPIQDVVVSKHKEEDKPTFAKAMVAPLIAIVLLVLNPIGSILGIEFLANIKIDSMIILPFAGIVGLIVMGKANKILEYTTSGLNKMTGTAIILIGAGAIAGIISNSNLSEVVMVHTGGVVLDQLPHGNFFHVTADAVKMNIKKRMGLIIYEAMVGGSMCIVATIIYGFIM